MKIIIGWVGNGRTPISHAVVVVVSCQQSFNMAWDLALPELLGRMVIVGVESHVGPIIDIQ